MGICNCIMPHPTCPCQRTTRSGHIVTSGFPLDWTAPLGSGSYITPPPHLEAPKAPTSPEAPEERPSVRLSREADTTAFDVVADVLRLLEDEAYVRAEKRGLHGRRWAILRTAVEAARLQAQLGHREVNGG